jgi:hypothetical protein
LCAWGLGRAALWAEVFEPLAQWDAHTIPWRQLTPAIPVRMGRNVTRLYLTDRQHVDVFAALPRTVEAKLPKLPILPYMSPGATDSTHRHPIY